MLAEYVAAPVEGEEERRTDEGMKGVRWWGEFVCLISPVVCRQSAAPRETTALTACNGCAMTNTNTQPSRTPQQPLTRTAQHGSTRPVRASLHCVGVLRCARMRAAVGSGVRCIVGVRLPRVRQLTLSVVVSGDFHPVLVSYV